MDRDVENFNTRLRTIKIWELTIGIIIALILSIILMFIFPIFETNDDAFMLLLLTLILVFFIWCLKGSKGLNDNVKGILQNEKEILYVFAINIIFAYLFLFSVVVLDMFIGMSDPTWISGVDIDSVSLTPSAFLYTLITSVVFAPIIEELVFRGVLFNRLKIRIGIVPAMLISSILFAIGHDFGGIVSAFLFGICMCILYLKTDNILIPMSVHLINNIVATLLDVTAFDAIITSFPWIILLGILILIATILLIKYIVTETKTLNRKFS